MSLRVRTVHLYSVARCTTLHAGVHGVRSLPLLELFVFQTSTTGCRFSWKEDWDYLTRSIVHFIMSNTWWKGGSWSIPFLYPYLKFLAKFMQCSMALIHSFLHGPKVDIIPFGNLHKPLEILLYGFPLCLDLCLHNITELMVVVVYIP